MRMNGPSLFKRWRKAQKLTQLESGAKLRVSGATISDWESEKKTPGAESIIRIEVLTGGECPIESWTDDPKIRTAMRQVLERRAIEASKKPPRRRRTSTAPPAPAAASDGDGDGDDSGDPGASSPPAPASPGPVPATPKVTPQSSAPSVAA